MKNIIVFILSGIMLLSVCGWVSKPQEDCSIEAKAEAFVESQIGNDYDHIKVVDVDRVDDTTFVTVFAYDKDGQPVYVGAFNNDVPVDMLIG